MTKHKDYQFWVPIGVIIVVALAITVGVVVALRPLPDTAEATCKKPGQLHEMSVGKEAVTPAQISGAPCDTLRIVNNTGSERTIMFGHADEMESYDGVHEKSLADGESFTVRLYQKGDFHFHEHESDLVGNFSVR